MSKVHELKPTGMANTNADVAAFLRDVADRIEGGNYGDVRCVMTVIEFRHDGVSDMKTLFAGRECDNARALGILTHAQQRFMFDQE